MSVTPISGSGVTPTQPQQSNWQNVLNSVSSTLGLSTTALQQQLQSGQSLSQIAQAQGVSQQTLVQDIASTLQQNGSAASATQLQQMATNIANRTPGASGHHHHHHGGGGSRVDAQQPSDPLAAASLFGTDSSLDSTSSSTSDSSDSQSNTSLDTFA